MNLYEITDMKTAKIIEFPIPLREAAEKNIINKDLGILDDFGILVEYKGNGYGEY